MVLLKGADERGLTFFSNYESRKGGELAANPRAALLALLARARPPGARRGRRDRLDPAESDAYFVARPAGSRLSAAASPQSRVVADRAELERLSPTCAHATATILRVRRAWGGFRLVPRRLGVLAAPRGSPPRPPALPPRRRRVGARAARSVEFRAWPEQKATEDLDRELIEFLNELRVALPGVQVLFAFLLAVPFATGWEKVDESQKYSFMVALLATALGSAS